MEKVIKLHNDEEANMLFGRHDENIKLVKHELAIQIVARGENLTFQGKEKEVVLAEKLFVELLGIIRLGGHIRRQDTMFAINALKKGNKFELHSLYFDRIEVMSKRQFVTPKTRGQKVYVDTIRKCDITFGIGPAGTGKTYLAMAMAISALKNQQVSRIILARPAVEAGESLGYLPGDVKQKISPYLRPIYDALYDMMELDKVQQALEKEIIEVAPLAYMRGRTLNDSFIILDEAQNSTPEQMKMFLTRLGFDSKAVITGDITQVDLPVHRLSGLVQVQSILKGISGIEFIYLNEQDVVRHELVQDIIMAYAAHEAKRKKKTYEAGKRAKQN
ncbi:MAG: PhoH family protein [Candidatus Omnitrophica bacterium]|nr:PhoH family protein [Candidatus Omnitrophota bacterium]MCG2703890.1 PhoH family protein [Candidatus Omnitrophota bacterium]